MRFVFVALAALATASPSAAPDYVAVVGPLHGAWLVDGKAATLGEKIAAGATFSQARPGTSGSIAIYVFDGRLIVKTCPSDPACGGSFALDPPGDTTQIKSVVQDATKALSHYRFTYATPAPQSAPPAPERMSTTPVDAVGPLGSDGAVDLGDLMQGVAFGPYRLVLRPLDPHSGFVASGDPIIKLVTWNGEAASVAVGGVPEGLYSAQLFSRDLANHALGGAAWAAVIAPSGTNDTRGETTRGETTRSEYRSARALAAKWDDPEATQLFLRSYLVNAVFPQRAPGPGRHGRRNEDRMSDVVLEHLAVGALECTCTIVADRAAGEAIVVDAGDDVDAVMSVLEKLNVRAKYLVHTHAHVDHIGALAEMRDRTNARGLLHHADLPLYSLLAEQARYLGMAPPRIVSLDGDLHEGDVIAAGDARLTVLHTPGHTPGSCSFAYDDAGATTLLTGDTLFAGAVGRWDLGGTSLEDIVTSIRSKLLAFDDATRVVPGHGPFTSIGTEREHNPFLT